MKTPILDKTGLTDFRVPAAQPHARLNDWMAYGFSDMKEHEGFNYDVTEESNGYQLAGNPNAYFDYMRFQTAPKQQISLKGSHDKITIVGGGVAGHALATLLQRDGVNYEILEKRKTTTPMGHGLLLIQNGVEALEKLGLKHQLTKYSNQINFLRAMTPEGKQLFHSPMEDCYAVSRPNLFKILESDKHQDHSRYGCEVKGYNSQTGLLELKDGELISSDLFVASDGLYSPIRNSMFPEIQPESVNEREIVATVKLEKPLSIADDEMCKIVDRKQGIALGVLPLGNNTYIWYLQFNPSLMSPDGDKSCALKAFVSGLTADYPDFVQTLLAATDFDNVHVWVSRRMDLLPSFHDGNMVLMGDAAHPMLPLTSQGANAAFADALSLYEHLCRKAPGSDFEATLNGYYNSRKYQIQSYINAGDELLADFQKQEVDAEFMVPLALK